MHTEHFFVILTFSRFSRSRKSSKKQANNNKNIDVWLCGASEPWISGYLLRCLASASADNANAYDYTVHRRGKWRLTVKTWARTTEIRCIPNDISFSICYQFIRSVSIDFDLFPFAHTYMLVESSKSLCLCDIASEEHLSHM